MVRQAGSAQVMAAVEHADALVARPGEWRVRQRCSAMLFAEELADPGLQGPGAYVPAG